MPGGGISKYEIPEQAAVREVEEETGLKIEQLEYLLGTYANDANGKNDTVYCFVARPGQKLLARRRFNLEISDYAWYGLTELPYGVSVATKRRITEFVEGHISEQVRQW